MYKHSKLQINARRINKSQGGLTANIKLHFSWLKYAKKICPDYGDSCTELPLTLADDSIGKSTKFYPIFMSHTWKSDQNWPFCGSPNISVRLYGLKKCAKMRRNARRGSEWTEGGPSYLQKNFQRCGVRGMGCTRWSMFKVLNAKLFVFSETGTELTGYQVIRYTNPYNQEILFLCHWN